MELTNLFRPITIAGIEIRNRIKMAPMAVGFAEDGYATDKYLHFFEERAQGGVGLIDWALWPYTLEHGYLPWVWDDKFIPGLKRVVDTVHKHGAKIIAQLGTGYGWAFKGGPVEVVGPSGISLLGRPGTPYRLGMPTAPGRTQERAMTVENIHEMVEGYGDAARRVREANFEGVELMLAGGYTLARFISAVTNKRTDEYGGSMENRMRLIREIVASTKKKAGPDFPVFVKISGDMFMDGGYTLQECAEEIVPRLEDMGISAVDVVIGWHESRPEPLAAQVSAKDGPYLYLAEAVKKKAKVPITGGVRVNDPRTADAAIAQGRIDMVAIGRQLLVDPEAPNKAKEGRLEDIRPCIACMNCFQMVDTPIECSVNPRLGREGEYIVEPTRTPKRVMVIGGGPAGMEAALVASRRGHLVTLVEKQKSLGGTLNAAAVAPFKEDTRKLLNYYLREMKRSGIKMKFGEEGSLATVSEANPDAVVVACGASHIVPDIPGVIRPNVVTAVDVLLGKKKTGNRVVIIGGGMVGCEVAEFLTQKAARVTILEMMGKIAADVPRAVRFLTMTRLKGAGIQMETNVQVTRISDHGVWGLRKGYEWAPNDVFFEGDTIVLALGMKPDDRCALELEGKLPTYNIGDSAQPGKIREAIRDGFLVAKDL